MTQNNKEKILVYPGAGLDFSPLLISMLGIYKNTIKCGDDECDCEKVHHDNSISIVKDRILDDITHFVFMDIETKFEFDNTLDLANFIRLYLSQYFKVNVITSNNDLLHCKITYCDFYELKNNPQYDIKNNRCIDFIYLFGVDIFNLNEYLAKICNKAMVLYQLGFWNNNTEESALNGEKVLANLFKNVNTIICQYKVINEKIFNEICVNKVKWVYSYSPITTYHPDLHPCICNDCMNNYKKSIDN